MSLTTAQEKELWDLIASGQKILAVKRYREITGVGLQEAMSAVTQIRPKGGIPTSLAAASALDPRKLKEAEAKALAAIREGNILEGIQRYRAHTNAGLKEAKDAVDALNISHLSNGRINPKVARALLALVASGRKQDAVTHLMSNVGFDEVEARAFIGNLAASQRGCASGCLRTLLLLLGLVLAVWFGLRQVGVSIF